MRILSNGQEVEIPTDEQGRADVAEVRRVANVPHDRALILQRQNGENFITPRHGRINVTPYDHFLDSPTSKRGKI